MDEKDLRKLYDAVSSRFDIGDYDTFSGKMQTPDDRKRFYDAVSSRGFDLGDYSTYESRLSGKKKDSTEASIRSSGSATATTEIADAVPEVQKSTYKSSAAPVDGVNMSVVNSLDKHVGRGLRTALRWIAEIPEFAASVATTQLGVVDAVSDLVYGKDRETPRLQETVMNFMRSENDIVNKFIKKPLDESINKYTEDIQKIDERVYDGKSAVDLLESGDIGGFARKAAESLAESIPSILAVAATGGAGGGAQMAAGTALFGAGSFSDVSENDEVSETGRALGSILNGSAEMVFERLGTLSIMKRIGLGTASKEEIKAAGEIAKQTYLETAKAFIKKNTPISAPIQEGLTEWATEVSQNTIDYISGASDNPNVFEGSLEALAIGAGSGAYIVAPHTASASARKLANKVKAKALEAKVQQAEKDIDEGRVPKELVPALSKEVENLNGQITDILKEDTKETNGYSADDVAEITDLNNKIEQKEQVLNGSEVSDATREAITKSIQADEKRIEEINAKYEPKSKAPEDGTKTKAPEADIDHESVVTPVEEVSEVEVANDPDSQQTEGGEIVVDEAIVQPPEQVSEQVEVESPERVGERAFSAEGTVPVSEKEGVKARIRRTTGMIKDRVTRRVDQLNKDLYRAEASGAKRAIKKTKELEKIFLEELKQTSLPSVNEATVKRVSRLVGKITNEQKLNDAIETLGKVAEDSEYLNKVSNAKKAIKGLRKLRKQGYIPANTRSLIKELTSLNPRRVSDIDEFNKILSDISESRKGAKSPREFSSDDIAAYVESQRAEIQKYMDDRDRRALERQIEAGLIPEGTTLDAFREIENKPEGELEEDYVKSAKEILEENIEAAKIAVSEVVPENATVKRHVGTILSGDTSKLSLNDMKLLNNVLNDIVDTDGELDFYSGLGKVAALIEGDSRSVELSEMGLRVREVKSPKMKGMTNFLNSMFFNAKQVAKFRSRILSPLETAFHKVHDDTGRSVAYLSKKIHSLKGRQVSDNKIGIYAILNQYDPETYSESFGDLVNKLVDDTPAIYDKGIATRQGSTAMRGEILISKGIARAEALKEMGLIRSFKIDGDKLIIEKLDDKRISELTIDDISLSRQESEIYKWILDKYSSITDALEESVYSDYNKEFVRENNYSALWLKPFNSAVEEKVDLAETDLTGAFKGVNKREAGTTVKRSKRIASKDKYYETSAFETFAAKYFESSITANAGYELHVVSRMLNHELFRNTVAGALDPSNKTKGGTQRVFETNVRNLEKRIQDYVNQEKQNSLYFKDNSSKIDWFMSRVISGLLHRMDQLPKQYVPNMLMTIIKVPRGAMYALSSRTMAIADPKYRENRGKFLSNFGIVRRKSEGYSEYNRAIVNMYEEGTLYSMGKKIGDAIDRWNPGRKAFEFSDHAASEDAIIAGYTQYLMDSKKIKSIKEFKIEDHMDNPDAEAMAYAESKLSEINAESVRANKADVLRDPNAKYLWMLKGFALNAFQNAANNVRVLMNTRASMEDRAMAMQGLGGYIAQIAIFHAISAVTRSGYDWLSTVLIELVTGDEVVEDEEDKEARADRSKVSAIAYALSDLFLSGVAAPIEEIAKSGLNHVWKRLSAPKREQMKAEGERIKGTIYDPYLDLYFGVGGGIGAAGVYIDLFESGMRSFDDATTAEGFDNDKFLESISKTFVLPTTTLLMGIGDAYTMSRKVASTMRREERAIENRTVPFSDQFVVELNDEQYKYYKSVEREEIEKWKKHRDDLIKHYGGDQTKAMRKIMSEAKKNARAKTLYKYRNSLNKKKK